MLLLLIGLIVVINGEWVIQLPNNINAREFGKERGLDLVGELPNLPGFYEFRATRGRTEPREIRDAPGYAERQVARWQHKRYDVQDPLYGEQWHLHRSAWSLEIDHIRELGRNVTIAIVDDGLQHTHPEISANYDARHSHDFNDGDDNPMPASSQDSHGTAAAGVAAAVRNNGYCGRGVAPSAKLVGLRTIGDAISDLGESKALSHNGIAVVDIYSCSWGPADDGMTISGPGYLTHETLVRYTDVGRLGKGNIYVWAAGNGREQGDSCAFDGYVQSPYVIPIGALDYDGNRAYYSESCSALFAVAPSSGVPGKGIATPGYLHCMRTFGGTSAAAPAAAGVIALLLELRPELTWRDVKHVIAKGATRITPVGLNHTAPNGHSNAYGFGLLKVPPLLHAARAHQLVPRMRNYQTHWITVRATSIPATATFLVHANFTFIEHVLVNVRISHRERGALKIVLQSPSSTRSLLAAPRPRDLDRSGLSWTFNTVHFWGEPLIAGSQWSLHVNHTHGSGTLDGYQVTFFGF